jgi:ketosteroid isomerase-like protein
MCCQPHPTARIRPFATCGKTISTDYRFDLVATGASGDLAYLVGFEHIAHSVEGVPVEPYTLRVTHIFRREQGEWRIVHRHADYIPVDQTAPAEASTNSR